MIWICRNSRLKNTQYCHNSVKIGILKEEKRLEKREKSKLCVFKIHLVLVAIVHKIIPLPTEISSGLTNGDLVINEKLNFVCFGKY